MFNLESLKKGDFYTGIGSRQTPAEILELMTEIARCLSNRGVVLRSGGAAGADSAFEQGAALKEVYLPWRGFNGNTSRFYHYTQRHVDMAKAHHPAWDRLSQGAQKLMTRNTAQLFGMDFMAPSKCVICWTRDGKASGGTGQAIRMAEAHGIAVINLYSARPILRP